ncbi:MAG: hypothetical protein HN390_04600 [Anaerolineae bacterium]|jgi:hypothetical protein|nr:hypothetical protein [Anaerolineae bacterium]MBT7070924.1 hypothetical protein [Anaerolineae bacterium]MBT7991613.1 hypothetical protein [Anaerolineae bacterium]
MTVQTHTNQTSVRPILYANAIFCGVSGLIFAIASKSVSAFLGLDASGIILALGIGLIIYAEFIYIFAKRPAILRNFVLFAIIADSLWVLGSILLLITNWVPFTVQGKWLIGIIAIIVDIFAALQFFKWQKME